MLFRNKKKFFILSLLSFIIICGCVAHYKTTNDNFTAVKDAESIERGKNLVFNICAGCHLNHEVNTFIGNRLHDIPRFLGKVYSANLTHSETFGVIPHYTDAQLIYFFKTGIAKDGRYIPYMLKPMLADEDINDIIVYLLDIKKLFTPEVPDWSSCWSKADVIPSFNVIESGK